MAHSFVPAAESKGSLVGTEEKALKLLATHLPPGVLCVLVRECFSAVSALERSCFASSKYYCDLLEAEPQEGWGGRPAAACGGALSGLPVCLRSRTSAEKDPKGNGARILDSYSRVALVFLGDPSFHKVELTVAARGLSGPLVSLVWKGHINNLEIT